MSVTTIASRYAKSLIDLAQERGKLEAVVGDIKGFKDTMNNRDLVMLVKSPIINAEKKQNVFKAIFDGKVDQLTGAFFDLIIRKGREQYLPEIVDAVIAQHRAIQGIIEATVTTATTITDAQLSTIKAQLSSLGVTAGGKVEIVTKVDPTIIGGFILGIGDKLYDASVKSKLAGLKKEILDNSYIKSL